MLAVLAAAVVTAAVAASSSPLPSAEELMARHHRAIGVLPATTAHWSGSLASGDLVERFEVTGDVAGRYRQSWTTTLGQSFEGSDGMSDWTEDENGDVSVS